MATKAIRYIAASIALLTFSNNTLAFSADEVENNNTQGQANGFIAVAEDTNLTISGDLYTSYYVVNGNTSAYSNEDSDWFMTSGWTGGANFSLTFTPNTATHEDLTVTLQLMDSGSNILGSPVLHSIVDGPLTINGLMPADGILYIALLDQHSEGSYSYAVAYAQSNPSADLTLSSYTTPYTLSLDVVTDPVNNTNSSSGSLTWFGLCLLIPMLLRKRMRQEL